MTNNNPLLHTDTQTIVGYVFKEPRPGTPGRVRAWCLRCGEVHEHAIRQIPESGRLHRAAHCATVGGATSYFVELIPAAVFTKNLKVAQGVFRARAKVRKAADRFYSARFGSRKALLRLASHLYEAERGRAYIECAGDEAAYRVALVRAAVEHSDLLQRGSGPLS